MTMTDPDIRNKLSSRVKREFRRRPPIRIKEFATKALTMAGIRAYLEGLERYEKFTPDLICVDYPDLMKLDTNNLRLELGDLIAELRGLAVARNAAMVIVSQGNRDSERASLVTRDMAAEDISKIATSDTVYTYSQTPAEKELGLARIFVEKARNEDSKMQVLITQAYAIGQFCLDSVMLNADYWDVLSDKNPEPRKSRRRDEP